MDQDTKAFSALALELPSIKRQKNDKLIKLNLGCGNKKVKNYIGLDKYPCAAVDIICDITETLPFINDSVDSVLLDNVIEHIWDIPKLMAEIIRACKYGAEIVIITPHFTSIASWKDPTHVHHLSYFSTDHFQKKGALHYMNLGGKAIHVKKRMLSFGGGLLGLIGRLIFSISPEYYEKKYCFLFRASTITWVLQVQ